MADSSPRDPHTFGYLSFEDTDAAGEDTDAAGNATSRAAELRFLNASLTLLGCLDDPYYTVCGNVEKPLHDTRRPADFHELCGLVRP